MAQIPNTFILFNQTWQIRTALPHEIPDDLGQCRVDQHEIVLAATQCDETLIHVLLHEICHCIEMKLHLEMTERQVDLMSLGILDLFRSNPNMISLLEKL
jgi:hypothetical protein